MITQYEIKDGKAITDAPTYGWFHRDDIEQLLTKWYRFHKKKYDAETEGMEAKDLLRYSSDNKGAMSVLRCIAKELKVTIE